jgi:hypothetical protein
MAAQARISLRRLAFVEYRIWGHIVNRCTNPNNAAWDNYGGRGIRVCAKWRDSFQAFLADVGLRPDGEGLTLDRINNNRGYEPGNVRWATRLQQVHNRRSWAEMEAGRELVRVYGSET